MATEKQLGNEPELAPPGAGLPFLEWAMAKYIIFPSLFRHTDKDRAIRAFQNESERIMEQVSALNVSQLSSRRLIPRLQGIEDSSRYWSVAMTVQHLVIVGERMRQIVLDLSQGGTRLAPSSTADLKPSPDVDAESVIRDFRGMTQRFVDDATAADIYAFPQARYPHPWFGPLNAHQWLAFIAPHQAIHRKQITEIIARL